MTQHVALKNKDIVDFTRLLHIVSSYPYLKKRYFT